MTQREFKQQCADALRGQGYSRGERVMVNGVIGTVRTKIVRGPGDIVQGVKFDEPITEDGKTFGVFKPCDLTPAAPVEGQPSEVDLLGQLIRKT